MSETAAPGWYPDPDPARAGQQRWWSGTAWAGETPAAVVPAAVVPAARTATPSPATPSFGVTRGQSCPVCGAPGSLFAQSKQITVKKRVKFGVFWVLFALFTLGLALILYLIMPRKNQVVAVDRYMECAVCHSRV